MLEIWKDIKGYDGYQVSNTGKVYSLKSKKILSQNLLNTYFGSRPGYYHVMLFVNGKKKNVLVHRLVAEAFIPNPENKPQVHHKDHNPHNNNANNLEWVTADEHAKHTTKSINFQARINSYNKKS
jgi:hypothetical protein